MDKLTEIDAKISDHEKVIENQRRLLRNNKRKIELWSEYRKDYSEGHLTYWKNAVIPILALSVPIVCLSGAVMFLTYRGTKTLTVAIAMSISTGYGVAFAVWNWFLKVCLVSPEHVQKVLTQTKQRRREVWHDRHRLRAEIDRLRKKRAELSAQMQNQLQSHPEPVSDVSTEATHSSQKRIDVQASVTRVLAAFHNQQRTSKANRRARKVLGLPRNASSGYCRWCGTRVKELDGFIVRVMGVRRGPGQPRIHCSDCAAEASYKPSWRW